MNTPWGQSQTSKKYATGITFYSTAGHGGIKVSDGLNKLIHSTWRNDSGWYEEDCEWAIVAFHFQGVFEEHLDSAIKILKDWYPEKFERVSGCQVQPHESFKLRRKAFEAENINNFVGSTAYGDWDSRVPKDHVGVVMKRKCDGAEKFIIVTKEHYDGRGEFGLVMSGGCVSEHLIY